MKKVGLIGAATLTAPMEAPLHFPSGDHKLKIAISYQACTKSYCLFPAKLHLEIPFSFFIIICLTNIQACINVRC